MASHEVTVTDFAERSNNVSPIERRPDSTLGTIKVVPPITIGVNGVEFGAVILGREAYGVTVKEVVTTPDCTIIQAEAGDYESDRAARQKRINEIAERIKLFADNPSNAPALRQQIPFPEAPERD